MASFASSSFRLRTHGSATLPNSFQRQPSPMHLNVPLLKQDVQPQQLDLRPYEEQPLVQQRSQEVLQQQQPLQPVLQPQQVVVVEPIATIRSSPAESVSLAPTPPAPPQQATTVQQSAMTTLLQQQLPPQVLPPLAQVAHVVAQMPLLQTTAPAHPLPPQIVRIGPLPGQVATTTVQRSASAQSAASHHSGGGDQLHRSSRASSPVAVAVATMAAPTTATLGSSAPLLPGS